MAVDYRISGTPVAMTFPDQGSQGLWRFGIDRGGVNLLVATEPDLAGSDPTHVFTIPAGTGTTAWYEALLATGAVIGSRTVSQPFDVVDVVPPPPQPRTYRVSGTITVTPVATV